MSEIQRTITFVISGATYEIKFPTVRQLVLIESNKASLTHSQYNSMIYMGTLGSEIALDFTDMVATLSVLCPEFVKDMKVESLLDLDILDAKMVSEAYQEQVKDWVNQWIELFRKPEDVKTSTDTKTTTSAE